MDEIPGLSEFQLAGGTALALKYGHRTSIDLDIFSHGNFQKDQIEYEIEKLFGRRFIYNRTTSTWSISAFIDDVKIDIIHYQHPLLEDPIENDGIRMLHDRDLLAMKVNAIMGRGKKKDF